MTDADICCTSALSLGAILRGLAGLASSCTLSLGLLNLKKASAGAARDTTPRKQLVRKQRVVCVSTKECCQVSPKLPGIADGF
jgi:hypothetical protein